jgi:hypothetical protein
VRRRRYSPDPALGLRPLGVGTIARVARRPVYVPPASPLASLRCLGRVTGIVTYDG